MASSLEGSYRCEDCMEDRNDSESVSEVPFADMYCTDCQKKLCKVCCRYHLKNKLSKNHQIVAIADFKCKVQIVVPNNCIKHKRELDLYCSECKEPLCRVCVLDRIHKDHKLQDVRSSVEGFKNDIKDILSGLHLCMSEISDKQEFLNCEVEEFCKDAESLKLEVLAQLHSITAVASNQACLVIDSIEQLKAQKRKEVDAEVEDSNGNLTYLESFKVFCTNVLTKRSASDICCTINELKERFEDIKKIHESDIEMKTDLQRMSFQTSDLEEFVKKESYNIIGTIREVHGEGETKIANENISHHGEIKMEENCVMASSCNNGILVKFNCLKQELDNSRRRIDELEMEKKDFEKRIDEFRVKLGKIGLQKPVSRWQMTQPAQPSCKNLPSPQGPIDYKRTPNMVKRMESDDNLFEEAKIFGLAVSGEELFVSCVIICSGKSIVEVYDFKTLQFKHYWYINRSLSQDSCIPGISCIASSAKNKCLYACIYTICDSKEHFHETVIQRTDMYGLNGKEWVIHGGTRISNISVSGEGHVVVITGKSHVLEYTSDGILVHEIKLPLTLGILYPWLALKVASGNFIVSHGQRKNTTHQVLLLTKSGEIIKSFGKYPSEMKEVPQVCNPRVLNRPVHVAVDDVGNVLVADLGNSRVVVLNAKLEFVCAIACSEPFEKPRCMCVNADRRQVFVCEGPRKIAVYDFCA